MKTCLANLEVGNGPFRKQEEVALANQSPVSFAISPNELTTHKKGKTMRPGSSERERKSNGSKTLAALGSNKLDTKVFSTHL